MERGSEVTGVFSNPEHGFSKIARTKIRLLAGLGVEGDAHCGATVRHRSRVAANPGQPNLRQAHLLPSELFDELSAAGFSVGPGDLGENISTRGLEPYALPRGTRLRIGASAIVEVTGLRNPCAQIETFCPGLLAKVLTRDVGGNVERRAGIMGVVIASGEIFPGDTIQIEFPPEPHEALDRV